jgi:ABC-type phosphate/phosphonate transport system substrate-binding protein
MNPIATLSMYDWPETRHALEKLWNLIANELEAIGITPASSLAKENEQFPLWTSSDLLIGQTCGWPYANHLRGKAVPFARFDYGLDKVPPGFYRSVYIGRSKSDAEHLTSAGSLAKCASFAVNGLDSQSGFHVFTEITGQPASTIIPHDHLVKTGAHRNSVIAVADGTAQIAAIDAVAFELAKRHEPDAAKAVAVIGYSAPKPGLPLITSNTLAGKTDELYSAIKTGISKLPEETRETLMIRQVLKAKDADYDVFLAN